MLVGLNFKNDGVESKTGRIPAFLDRYMYTTSSIKQVGIMDGYQSMATLKPLIDYNVNPGFARVTFNGGMLCVYGGYTLIEEGTEFDISLSSTGSFKLIARVELPQTPESEVTFAIKSGDLVQNDLQNSSGIFELELCRFIITNSFNIIGIDYSYRQLLSMNENPSMSIVKKIKYGCQLTYKSNIGWVFLSSPSSALFGRNFYIFVSRLEGYSGQPTLRAINTKGNITTSQGIVDEEYGFIKYTFRLFDDCIITGTAL